MFNRILVPYDNSEQAQRALSAAIDMAEHGENVKVVALAAADFPRVESAALTSGLGVMEAAPAIDMDQMVAMQETFKTQQLEEHVANVAAALGDAACGVECRVGLGRPQDVIVDAVEEEPFDLVIMGSRGLGAVRGMLGSVSSAVLHDVKIPVMVVK